jgi:hypothetical protein
MNSLVHGVVTKIIHSVSQDLILKISAFFPQCIYEFKINLKMKSVTFLHSLTGFCNGDEMFPVR